MPSMTETGVPAGRLIAGLLACLALAGTAVAVRAEPQAAVDAEAPALYRVIHLRPQISLTSLPDINARDQVVFGLETPVGQRGFFYDGTRVRDIGTLGGPSTWVAKLNDAGQVTGRSEVARDTHHAFVWSVDGGMVDLGTLPEASHSVGNDINNHGVVTGTSWGDFVPPHAFRWSAESGMEDLGAFTTGIAGISYGQAINDAGLITGVSDTEEPARHAFVWTRETGLVDIHTLAGQDSYPVAVGAAGEVAGHYLVDGRYRAFLWTAATGMRDLGTAGGNESLVIAMSDNARIAGVINLPDEIQHAMTWTRAGGMVDLGTLGGVHSRALDVNNKGQVVGAARNAAGQFRGFVWSAGRGMVDLNTRLRNAPPGLVVGAASAISGNGAIVAESSAGLVLLKPCCGERPRGAPTPAPAR